jgi:ribosomal protein S18 acetylase RimI-like enzyme
MSLPEGYAIRRASADDIDTLVAHRRAMFVDMGYRDDAALDAMAAKCHSWLLTRMSREEYLAWLAIAPDKSVAAGTGLWLMDWIPHMVGSGRRGNILNVYTAVEFRRRGLAGELMKAAMEWCRANGVDVVVLHASADGRGLYESMGFTGTNEMRIQLGSRPSIFSASE